MSRSLTYSGTGTLRTWFEPSALQDQIANSLRVHGWGFSDLKVTNSLGSTQALTAFLTNPGVAAIPTWNYNIVITITDVSDDDNPERARVALTNLLANQWFSNVNLKLTRDSARPVETWLQNYGLWIAAAFAGLIVFTTITRQAAPVAVEYARRRYSPY